MKILHLSVLSVTIIITINIILVNGYAQNLSEYQNEKLNTQLGMEEIPPTLSQSDIEKVKQIALSDITVKRILEGEPYELMSYDFVGNVYHKPVVWYPELHFNIDNKTQLTVVINLNNDSVIYSQTSEMLQLGRSSSVPTQNQSNLQQQLDIGQKLIEKNEETKEMRDVIFVIEVGIPIAVMVSTTVLLFARKRK